MPCIMSTKNEIFEISRRFPNEIERIRQWEALVALASKRLCATFFHKFKVSEEAKNDIEVMKVESGIDGVVEWSKTSRGGAQFDLLKVMPAPLCQSEYGLCE